MTKERMEKIRFWYGIFLSLFTVVIGILFIAQTWSIFRAASEAPYTAERISKHFQEIAIPVWLWVAAACGDLVWSIVDSLFIEPKKGRLAAQVDLKMAISRVKKRMPAGGAYLPRVEGIERKHAIYRGKISGIFGGAVCLLAVFTILLLTDVLYLPVIKAHFFAAHDGVVDRITQTAVLAIVGLGLLSVATWLKEKDRKEEHKEYLAVLVAVKKESGKTIEDGGEREEVEEKKESIFDKLRAPFKRIRERMEISESTKKKCTLGLRIGLGVLGVLCIGIGIYNGGMQDVLLKAINICTQCIGLG